MHTLLSTRQGPRPEHLEGEVFLGPDAVKRDYIAASRDRGDETFHRIRCIRTTNFKYIRNFYPEIPYTQYNHYKGTSELYRHYRTMQDLYDEGQLDAVQSLFFAPRKPEEELFDLRVDRWEVNNLAGDPAMAETLTDMRGRLDRWMAATDDPLLRGSVSAPSGAKVNDPDGLSPREPTEVIP